MSLDNIEYTTKLSFWVEWFDYEADFIKKLLLFYFPFDSTVELFDNQYNRVFLKRAICETVQQKELFLGNRVRVFGRQLEIKDYADCFTEKVVGKMRQHTFAVIKPSAVLRMGEIISDIESRQFQICRMQMSHLTRKEAADFYVSRKEDVFLPFIIEHIISGPIIAMEIVGEDAVKRFRGEIGNINPEVAKQEQPHSFRAKYGHTTASNGFHAADSLEAAISEADYFFPQGSDKKPPLPSAKFENCTCCVIKPHAVAEGKSGYILSSILGNELFKISGLQMIYLSYPDAEEFLEIYKGVVSDYNALLLSFLDGPCIALEICGHSEEIDVHQEFRKFAGPSNSDIARQIRPNTLRGLYGVDKYRNAVHCTDLPDDTILELEYFFKMHN